MIFDGKFANFHEFSLNFCQQVDFLPEGVGRIFVKYSPVQETRSKIVCLLIDITSFLTGIKMMWPGRDTHICHTYVTLVIITSSLV